MEDTIRHGSAVPAIKDKALVMDNKNIHGFFQKEKVFYTIDKYGIFFVVALMIAVHTYAKISFPSTLLLLCHRYQLIAILL